MKVTVEYSFIYGKLDASDMIPKEIELTQEEETAYKKAIEAGVDPNGVPELADALERVYDELHDKLLEELDEEEFEDEEDFDPEDALPLIQVQFSI